MKRFAALLATGAALSALAVTGASQASAQTTGGPTGPTKNCVDGFPGVVNLRLCASVTGDQVVFSGYATPASVAWNPQKVAFNLTAACRRRRPDRERLALRAHPRRRHPGRQRLRHRAVRLQRPGHVQRDPVGLAAVDRHRHRAGHLLMKH